jgi:superfamily II DNA/RNA helicase
MADNDINQIFKNSDKAELLERFTNLLEKYDSAVIVFTNNNNSDNITTHYMLLGHDQISAFGAMELAKMEIWYDTIEDTEDIEE